MKHESVGFSRKRTTLVGPTVAIFAAMALGACGGGSGGGPGAVASDRSAAPQGIKVEGHSQSVEAVDGQVQVVLPPVPSSNYGMVNDGSGILRLDAARLDEAAPGAYKTFGDRASLSIGTITDLSGNGQYAIGRWTAGTDSHGGTYNANQGRAWAVGKPLELAIDEGSAYACKLEAATRPVAIDGNTAPGELKAGTARVYVAGRPLDTGHAWLSPLYDLSLDYSIGSDVVQGHSATAISIGLVTSRAQQHAFLSRLVGSDASKPYLAVAYTMQAPTAGTIHGVAVMACDRLPQVADAQPGAADGVPAATESAPAAIASESNSAGGQTLADLGIDFAEGERLPTD